MPNRAFSSAGVPVFGYPPGGDDHHLIGQCVGFFQVLRGQQHGGAGPGEVAHRVPQREAALRVQAGSGLIEEQHLRPVQQRRGARRAGAASRPSSRARAGRRVQPEAVKQLVGADPGLPAAHPGQPPDQPQVLPPGQVGIHGRELARQADNAAYPRRLVSPRPARRRSRGRRWGAARWPGWTRWWSCPTRSARAARAQIRRAPPSSARPAPAPRRRPSAGRRPQL